MSELEYNQPDNSENIRQTEFDANKIPVKCKDLNNKTQWLYPNKLADKVLKDLSVIKKDIINRKALQFKSQYNWPIRYAKLRALGFWYDELSSCFAHKRNLLK